MLHILTSTAQPKASGVPVSSSNRLGGYCFRKKKQIGRVHPVAELYNLYSLVYLNHFCKDVFKRKCGRK